MKIHVFNPEHEIALATNVQRFTAPHAARHLRRDLGFMPSLWADDGDIVVVDDVEAALEAVRHLKRYAASVVFVTMDDLSKLEVPKVCGLGFSPWGWDMDIKSRLLASNSDFACILPSDEILEMVREMSNRRFCATRLLPGLIAQSDRFVGESVCCADFESIRKNASTFGNAVLKSPWSSSGRGIRYAKNGIFDNYLAGWCKNILRQQGTMMVEPYYDKVVDFGMEFNIDSNGKASYCGLSLFRTANGSYAGNILATEEAKRSMLARYIDGALLDLAKDTVLSLSETCFAGIYSGPFGIDMMIVRGDGGIGFKVHPCVEMNLRRTMGHVALAISPDTSEPQGVFKITFDGRYRLRIAKTNENLLNTSLA